MEDITNQILHSQILLKIIDINDYLSFINAFADTNNLRIDWDKNSGEEWGQVFHEKKMVMIFCAKIPLMFVQDQYSYKLKEAMIRQEISEIEIIETQDWDEKKYSLDTEKVIAVLPWHSSISSIGISINDLWFATI